jgi:hypothetical protein
MQRKAGPPTTALLQRLKRDELGATKVLVAIAFPVPIGLARSLQTGIPSSLLFAQDLAHADSKANRNDKQADTTITDNSNTALIGTLYAGSQCELDG